MKSVPIHIHSFVYKGDSDIIEETVLGIRQALPHAHIVIIDDANAPCSEKIEHKIKKIGVEWRRTTWPRGGNLRGKPCIEGILEEMNKSATGDDDLLVKIDADTCLMNPGEILDFAQNKNGILCSSGAMNVQIYGCFYCIRAHAVKSVLNVIRKLPVSRTAPEDLTIGRCIFHLFPDESNHHISPAGIPDSKWRAYNWNYYPDTTMYRGATIVTTGNKPPFPLNKSNRLPIMRALRSIAKLKQP